ncbi:hypothetical protein [Spartinivicinus ruber]|uniref:hypothetical protein n=1 Tax=Spartinivicinus ruber TaxID=2683272 RepID=UPI0013D364F6|nr:hypothetical protein [Spartinivicinus ruber]
MSIKHILLMVLVGLPISLSIIYFVTGIDLAGFMSFQDNAKNEIVFKSESGSITAQRSDITGIEIGKTRKDGHVVHLELTSKFGEKMFLFTSKNLGAPLSITAFGTNIEKSENITSSQTNRMQIIGLTKKEAELLVNNLKKIKEN